MHVANCMRLLNFQFWSNVDTLIFRIKTNLMLSLHLQSNKMLLIHPGSSKMLTIFGESACVYVLLSVSWRVHVSLKAYKKRWLSVHWQKMFLTLSRFWPLREWGIWLNPLNKENSWQKSFFQILLNEVLKNCEKWYLLM